ncbi:MAG: FtsX-like permease family protein [Chloroflexi bacterium]|nr:FtsX-like permease family protein [Chloroflexota bacterium]
MDSLFGIPLTSILVALLLALGAIFGVLAVIALRQPLLVRMGLRNIGRRRTQTSLIVIGLMLSTLIISAAFATGDTVGYSITNEIYDSFEEVDFVIGFDDEVASEREDRYLTDEFLGTLTAEFGDDPDIDGISGLLVEVLPALNAERRLAEPVAGFIGVDPSSIDTFNGLKTLDGELISASTLGGMRAYASQDLAEQLDVSAGDTVQIFHSGQPAAFEVIDVIQDTSLTEAQFGGGGGLITSLDVAREVAGLDGKLSAIVVSITGGVRDTLDMSGAVEERLEAFIDAHPEGRADVIFTKEQAVGLAETIGSIFVAFFLIFGLFAIASGVLLIFMIFVMLAAERRSEMGMARAIGMQRLHLTETFLAEGMAYNLGSAAVGALLGLGVAFVLVLVLGQIFSDAFGFGITFHFNWQGFLIAYSLGVVLTFGTVAFSSFRIANLNIVRAIRDLPEPQPLGGADRSIGALLKSALGALWLVAWLVALVVAGVATLLVSATVITAAFGDLPTALSGLFGGAALMGVATLMFFGQRTVRRGAFRNQWNWRHWLLWAVWLLVFNVVAALVWLLQLSRVWAGRHRNAGGWAVIMAILGALLVWLSGWGVDALSQFQGQAFSYTSGFNLVVLGIAMLTVYFGLNQRLAFSAAGLGLVWYWILPLPFSLFTHLESVVGRDLDPVDGIMRVLGLPRPMHIEGNVEMFFVSGIAVTSAAVIVIILNAELALAPVRWLGGLLGGIAPAIKTAIAYPVAAKFRTGMTLAMFGIVVFSVVVMATLNSNFTQAFLSESANGGFDVTVDVNPNNRIPDLREALQDAGYDPGTSIGGVGRLASVFPQVRRSDDPDISEAYEPYHLAAVDDEFIDLQRLPVEHHAVGYDTDEAVWEAVRTDPTVAVIDASRLQPVDDFGGGPQTSDFYLGVTDHDLRHTAWDPIPITVRDPSSGLTTELKIIGVLEPQVTAVIPTFFAIFTHASAVEEHFEGGDLEQYFVVTAASSDEAAIETARDIESTLLELGVQADSIDKLIDDQASQSRSFQYLFEGFMALGLIVGIAALGVIAFRTVVERRQQIGMLRAIGYSRRLVAVSYFLESSFIALAGIAIGVVLGLAISHNLLASPEFTGGTDIDFQVPWARLAVILVGAYGASALMTLLPARAASRVAVAEALRYE